MLSPHPCKQATLCFRNPEAVFSCFCIYPVLCGNQPPFHLENNRLNMAEIALMRAALTDYGPIQILPFTLSNSLVQCTGTWLCFSLRQLLKQRLLLFPVAWASWIIGRYPVSAGTSTAAVGSLSLTTRDGALISKETKLH